MSALPAGWRTARLDELCEVNPRDKGPENPSTKVSFVPMPAVSDVEGVILPHDMRQFGDVAQGYTRFRDGDVIFAKITPCMENGKIAVAAGLQGGMACGSTEFHVLRSKGAILPEYVWRFLRQVSFREEAERQMTGAVGQRRVPADYLKQSVIPFPTLPEQCRILAKLDDMFRRTGTARSELNRIHHLADRYKLAVLGAAFRGELTASYRAKIRKRQNGLAESIASLRSAYFRKSATKEKPPLTASWTPSIELPPGWEWTSVDALSVLVQYGSSAKTSDVSAFTAVPVLRMGNIVDGTLSYDHLKYLPAKHPEFPDLLLQPGDILFNRTNSAELVGKSAVYLEENRKTSFASYLIRLKVVGYLPELVSAYINSEYGREWVRSVVNQQVGQANVNGTKLRELGVPLIPMDEQEVLMSKIRASFAAITNATAEVAHAKSLLDRLDEATLSKAFRGELPAV